MVVCLLCFSDLCSTGEEQHHELQPLSPYPFTEPSSDNTSNRFRPLGISLKRSARHWTRVGVLAIHPEMCHGFVPPSVPGGKGVVGVVVFGEYGREIHHNGATLSCSLSTISTGPSVPSAR